MPRREEPEVQVLSNPRNAPVEVHLPDRVVFLAPGESVTVPSESSPQLEALVRRGLLILQTPGAGEQPGVTEPPPPSERPTSKKAAGRRSRSSTTNRGGK